MSNALPLSPLANLLNEASKYRWRASKVIRRVALAWRFATNTWTEGDALEIGYACDVRSGNFSLECVTVENVLNRMREKYQDNPAFADLAHQATRRAWNKWESGGDLTNEAEAFAIEIFEEYAAADGVALIEIE